MKHRYMLLLLLAVMFCLCFFLFTSFYNQAKQEAIKDSHNEQLLYARQAARGIEDFFNNWTHTLTALSEMDSIINLDKRGKEDMELLYRANRNRIRAITRVDATGKIIYTFPFNRGAIGKDISRQDHVREIMRTHKPVVSNVFPAVQGYDTVAFQVPVFSNKKYKGTIGINVNFHELAKQYIENIKIGNTGYAWMISRDGTELYCPVPGHTGKSVFENCKDFPSILVMAKDMLKGNQGLTTYTFDMIRGDEVENVKKHAVYMPINVGSTFWSIVVVYSEDEIIASLKDFRNKLIGVILFLLLFGVLFAYYGLKILFVIREEKKRRNAEAALRKSDERFRAIFNSTFQFTGLMTPDGILIEANQTALDFAGIRLEDIINRPFWEARWWRGDEGRVKQLKQAISRAARGEFIRYEVELQGAGETTAIIDFSLKPFRGQDGEVALLIPEGRDITEHKQIEEEKRKLEERLQRAEKMEALGTLAGGVAHDLNNVLGIVVGYSEMLMDEIGESSPLRDNVTKIMAGGQRSAAIVQDLLTLARRGVQSKSVFNLNNTIMDCQKSPEFEKATSLNPHVRIKTVLEADLLNIMGSPIHLGKTFINLVANAVEAMPGGGMLTIATSNQSLDKPIHGYDAVNVGDYVVLSVTDTGEGISDNDLKHIFEPFYTKKVMGKRSGTGLGLAVVWGTIKDHNGYIDVKSEVGKGTTFSLYFPVTREEMAKAEAAIPLSDYIGNDESILVIDDIKEQRELAAKMLGKLNYRVKTVSSGEEAVEYLRTEKADLLVLDMIMDPGMDGLDTYKAILAIHPKQKAIIVSGFSETDRVLEARSLGAGEYLRKPYVIERLGMAARKGLDRT